jgi:hypothetical protein
MAILLIHQGSSAIAVEFKSYFIDAHSDIPLNTQRSDRLSKIMVRNTTPSSFQQRQDSIG